MIENCPECGSENIDIKYCENCRNTGVDESTGEDCLLCEDNILVCDECGHEFEEEYGDAEYDDEEFEAEYDEEDHDEEEEE